MACSKSSRQAEGCTSNALDLDIVIDKILECLPIRVAAQTSVLSEQWRRSWLSLRRLKFDKNFWEEQENNWLECSCIISSILLHHNGPVHYFYLDIPPGLRVDYDLEGEHRLRTNHSPSQWMSFLSKSAIREININNKNKCFRVSSYIFSCSQLVQLRLTLVTLSRPPSAFGGFPNLRQLNLFKVHFAHPDILCSMIANCSHLATLKLLDCTGINQVKIDVPSLINLTLTGYFESISLINVPRLKSIIIFLEVEEFPEKLVTNIIDVVNVLASSRKLRTVVFGDVTCQIMAAGGFGRSRPLAFNHVTSLFLYNLDHTCFDAFGFILSMVESCPNVQKLNISVIGSKSADDHRLDYNLDNKLYHLVEVQIKGTPGSIAELKLIEYLLAVSVVLKQLSYNHKGSPDESEMLKFSRALNRLPRASPKARLVC